MKRSEMLDLIGEAIYTCEMEDDVEIIASMVLTVIEEAGMLPHFIINDGGIMNKKQLLDAYEIDGDFRWEDETK
jgi:hypothetical protein